MTQKIGNLVTRDSDSPIWVRLGTKLFAHTFLPCTHVRNSYALARAYRAIKRRRATRNRMNGLSLRQEKPSQKRKRRVQFLCMTLLSLLTYSNVTSVTRTVSSVKSFSEFEKHFLWATVEFGYEGRISETGWDEAFVSFFSGATYVQLIEVVIEAVHTFSNRTVLVYGAGVTSVPNEWFTKFPRLILYRMPITTMHPWFDKLRAVLLAPVQKGVILEADTIISPSANNLFSVLNSLSSEESLGILAPEHPDTRPRRLVDCKYDCYECCINSFNYPNELRRGQYKHAHLMWTKWAKPFIQDVLKGCIEGPKEGDEFHDCSSDEAALNLAMWRSTYQVESLCMQDPDSSFWEEMYFSEDQRAAALSIQEQLGPRTIAFNFCHGIKDAAGARRMLGKLKNLFSGERAAPWILHNGSFSATPPTSPNGLSGHMCLIS